ncbi:MAG: hypothetical protein ABI539_04445 [Acidobacteriota bacterium]
MDQHCHGGRSYLIRYRSPKISNLGDKWSKLGEHNFVLLRSQQNTPHPDEQVLNFGTNGCVFDVHSG